MVRHAPVEKVEAWREGIDDEDSRNYQQALDTMGPDMKNDIELAARDVDDWAADVQTIDCGSSIGVLGDGPNREYIDWWQQMCGRGR